MALPPRIRSPCRPSRSARATRPPAITRSSTTATSAAAFRTRPTRRCSGRAGVGADPRARRAQRDAAVRADGVHAAERRRGGDGELLVVPRRQARRQSGHRARHHVAGLHVGSVVAGRARRHAHLRSDGEGGVAQVRRSRRSRRAVRADADDGREPRRQHRRRLVRASRSVDAGVVGDAAPRAAAAASARARRRAAVVAHEEEERDVLRRRGARRSRAHHDDRVDAVHRRRRRGARRSTPTSATSRAYIVSIEPPRVSVRRSTPTLAARGQSVFERTARECHGTYGAERATRTCSSRSTRSGPIRSLASGAAQFAEPFVQWFAHSFYGETARLDPQPGYSRRRSTASGRPRRTSTTARCRRWRRCSTRRKRPRYWTRAFDRRARTQRRRLASRSLEHGQDAATGARQARSTTRPSPATATAATPTATRSPPTIAPRCSSI